MIALFFQLASLIILIQTCKKKKKLKFSSDILTNSYTLSSLNGYTLQVARKHVILLLYYKYTFNGIRNI